MTAVFDTVRIIATHTEIVLPKVFAHARTIGRELIVQNDLAQMGAPKKVFAIKVNAFVPQDGPGLTVS